jgi:hypothetical protein
MVDWLVKIARVAEGYAKLDQGQPHDTKETREPVEATKPVGQKPTSGLPGRASPSISDRAEAAITTGSTFTLTVECVD